MAPAQPGRDELVFKDPSTPRPTSWSPDGRMIALAKTNGRTGLDVAILRLDGSREASVAIEAPGSQDHAVFSPDGRWIAYSDAEGSVEQVFVQPFPPTREKRQVSRSGGIRPMWRSDGSELFFMQPDGMLMSAAVTKGSQFESGTPQALFQTGVALGNNTGRQEYAVSRDGQRFLINTPDDTYSPTLTFVSNWQALVHY